MRASRLVQLLLMLQARGRTTAAVLAADRRGQMRAVSLARDVIARHAAVS